MTVQEWLKGDEQGISIMQKKYMVEGEDFDQWLDRVSAGDEDVKRLIREKKFMFGGRILSNRGLNDGSINNCFTKGHKVITRRGLVNIEDVVIGDYVVTEDNSWQRVNDVMSRSYSGDLYEIQMYGGIQAVTCTPNHEFLTEDGWVRADRLVAQRADKHRYRVPHHIKLPTIVYEPDVFTVKLTDYIDLPESRSFVRDGRVVRIQTDFIGGNGAHGSKTGSRCYDEVVIDDDVRYLIGRWLGDGSVTKLKNSQHHSIFQIVFNVKEQDSCDKCVQVQKDSFGIEPTVITNAKQHTLILRTTNYLLSNFFYKFCGEKCDAKHIPESLIGSFSLLLGLLDADGSVSKEGHLSITLKGKRIIEDVKQSLLLNGIPSANIKEAITKLNDRIFSNNLLAVGKNFAHKRIIPYMNKCYDDGRMQRQHVKPFFTIWQDGNMYIQVQAINILADQQTQVYNLSVENVHSYTVNGVVAHNCYSAGFASDDYEDLLELNKQIGMTYKSQGGQGISLSKLRPKGTPIGKRYHSDGIIPFMEIFNTTTAMTSQGGSRKGALMMSLDARHKEIEDFIKIKSESGKIEKANLSVELDDEFMEAVDAYYKTGEEVVLHERREYSGHVVEYDITPIKIYKMMIETAYDWGEPGCLFVNRFRNYNMMECDPNYVIETANPCGEQALAKHSACCQGSLNLSEYVNNPYQKNAMFDLESFINDVKIAVRAMDDVVDDGLPLHPLKEQREMAYSYRNIGVGIMGYGTALLKLGLTYGGDSAIRFTDSLFRMMLLSAIHASNRLAKKKGAFPAYDPVLFDSSFIKRHLSSEEIEACKQHGLRNCSLLSIAPTGSIATMLGVSTGQEPEFSIKYTRKTESLDNGKEKYFDVYCKAAQEYLATTKSLTLPSYFVCAGDIDWHNRVKTQAVTQEHIDTAISSTVNLPHDISLRDVELLYLEAWKAGLKGITIFRDGCKRAGVLTTSSTPSEPATELKWGDVIPASDNLVGKKRKLITGCGSLHCQAFFDPVTGRLMETYLSKGSTGGCSLFMTGLSRMISLAARAGCTVDNIIDQLNSCGVCPSYAVRTATKKDTSRGSCCPIAVGNALKDMWEEMHQEIGMHKTTGMHQGVGKQSEIASKHKQEIESTSYAKCPECDNEIINEGGCVTCKNCGWSRCS